MHAHGLYILCRSRSRVEIPNRMHAVGAFSIAFEEDADNVCAMLACLLIIFIIDLIGILNIYYIY